MRCFPQPSRLPLTCEGNRFELLQSPSPSPSPRFDVAVTARSAHPYPRRHRYSRGTREAKRRRDARRNRRKLLAAQELDAQLSRNIDETHTSANIYRPPLRLPAPTPQPQRPTIEHPQPARVPPTPPQLPSLDFGRLDLLRDFPQLARFLPNPSPPPPIFMPQVPSWCPTLPAITGKRSSADDLPLFFDLSSLPEPFQTPGATAQCHDLQLWRPKVSPQPPKQSRFFPPRPTSPRADVKLPSTSCALHKSDAGVQVDLPPPTQRQPTTPVENKHETSQNFNHTPKDDAEASAANLWSILTSNEATQKEAGTDPYIESFGLHHAGPPRSGSPRVFDTRMEAIGMPAELESTEVPYVHANSLTGQGNERAEYPGRVVEEHRTVVCDTPWPATPMEDMYPGLNEMVVDHAFNERDERRYWDAWEALYDLPPLPASPVELEAAVPDAFSGTEADDKAAEETDHAQASVGETSSHHFEHSDDHFTSEHGLFNHDLSVPSAGQDFIDVASFLELGHVPNCWCRPCQDMSDFNLDDDLPELLNPADEEWTVCSSASDTRSPSSCSAWEWEWGTMVSDEDEIVDAGSAGKEDGEDRARWMSPSVKAHGAW